MKKVSIDEKKLREALSKAVDSGGTSEKTPNLKETALLITSAVKQYKSDWNISQAAMSGIYKVEEASLSNFTGLVSYLEPRIVDFEYTDLLGRNEDEEAVKIAITSQKASWKESRSKELQKNDVVRHESKGS